MKTNDLARQIADKHVLSSPKAREVVNAMVNGIAATIARDEEVSLSGLGRFRVRETTARTGRNPRTGAPMEITAGKKVSFTPARALKGKL